MRTSAASILSCSGKYFGDSFLKYRVMCFLKVFFHCTFVSLLFPTSLSLFWITLTNSQRQGSRRRHKGSDYTSTSDEEYESNWSNLKHKRSQPSSASHSPRSQPRPQPVVAQHPKPRSRNSEEENHDGEALHNWSSHSAQIAR